MKILKVRLSNLNSLKGEHVVDFTQEPLASAGIFAITGPTGAGKTTLLDAITLALYGKVARYGNDANPPDVMTRGTASCHAEVTFEVRQGVFVAQWSLARARGALEGNVQPVRRVLRSEDGRILAEQVRAVNEEVEKLLGLDHDRFMRSAMLAQGQFARFLTAKPDERAQLLESLTGSEVYSQIGAMVFEEASRVAEIIRVREAELLAIVLLAEEEAQRLRDAMNALQKQQVESRAELQGLAERKAKIAELESAQRTAAQESARLGTAEQEAARQASEFKALELHQATLPFTEALTRLRSEQGALESAVAEAKEGKDSLDEARKQLSVAAADYAAVIDRELDEAGKAKVAGSREQEAAEVQVEKLSAWLKAHKQDEQLGATLGQLSRLLVARDAAGTKLDEAWADWKAQAGSVPRRAGVKVPADPAVLDAQALGEHVEAVKVAAREERDAAVTTRDEAKEALGRAHEIQKAALLVQKYEKDRAALREGEPCPLCGSTKHPHAGGAPVRDRIAKDLQAAQDALDSAGRDATDAATRCSAIEQAARRLLAAHQQALARLADCEKGFRAAGLAPTEDVEALQARANKHAQAKERLADAQSEVKQAAAAVVAAERQLVLLRKRKSAGLDLPEGVKAAARGEASLDLDEAAGAFEEARAAFNEAQAVLARCAKRLQAAQAAHDVAREAFERKIEGSAFKDAKAVERARLSDREATRITRAKETLDQRIGAAKALLAGAREAVDRLVKAGVPQGREADKVKERHDELVDKVETVSATITEHRRTLADDAARRKEKARLEKELQAERVEVKVWSKLRELVGSKDGAKFRKFAQSITLQILTRHANRHLARLNDRYALLLQEGDSLELQIEDGYQAGTRRPLASLSGGESFLASLALALGLSDLAGRTVNIDTLFIDEGFGSLDPETLDVALTALEALRQGNKSVGVISHVGLLKERIHTQIVVHKGASGHSRIAIHA